jgi:hypothetical protein
MMIWQVTDGSQLNYACCVFCVAASAVAAAAAIRLLMGLWTMLLTRIRSSEQQGVFV